MNRVLITGGAGFIGLHLARALAAEGAEVVLADDLTRGRRDRELEELLASPSVSLVTADLTDPASFGTLPGRFDEVYHLAAVIGVKHVRARPHDVVRVNALATLHLLEWMRRGGGARLLFASTSEAYAWTQLVAPLPIPTPEDVPLALTDLDDARSSYAGSKIFGELAVRQYGAKAGIPFAIVRYHNVYGPRMGYDHVIPELFARAREPERPLTVYAPDHRRAFCYVSDAVRGTIAALRSPRAAGATINVGNDREEVTIRELAERILRVAGLAGPLAGAPAPGDPVRRRCPNLARARALLGYEPAVLLDEGLARTLDWYAKASG